MADIISRLKLESGEFDSKIKRAGQELMAYSEHCRKTGLIMGYSNQDARDFAKALGSMQTTSTTARGKISELSDAFVNLRVMYKNMTDEEKNNQFGKNLSASLDQLKVRIQEAKKDLSDVTAELNGTTSVGKGGFLSGMGDKMSGMLQVFGGNMLTKGVSMLTSELAGSVQQSIELARQGEGVRMAFERLDQPGLLDSLKEATHGTISELELMKQAVKFENFKLPVEDLANYLAFAQQKAKDTGESIDYLVNSITTGLGRQSKQILDNLGISAAELTRRMNEGATMTQAVSDIIREEMAKAGDYVETAADRAARAAADTQNKMEELGRSAMPVAEEFASAWAEIRNGAMTLVLPVLSTVADSIRDIREILGGEWDMPKLKPGIQNLAEGPVQSNRPKRPTWGDVPVVKAPGGYVEVTDQSGKVLHGGHYDSDAQLQNMMKRWNTLTSATGGTRRTSSPSRQQTEMQRNQTRINDLTQKYVALMAAASKAGKPLTDEQQKQTSEIQRQISELEKRNGQLKLYEEQAKGRMLGNESFRQKLQVEVNANNQQIEALQTQLKKLTDPKTVTVTAETDEAARKLEGLNAVRLSGKTFAVTLSDDAVTEKLNAIAGITIDPKTVTVTAETDEAARKLEGLNAVRLSGKTFAVTLSDDAVTEKLNAIAGITINPKTVTVTAETDEAARKLEGLNAVRLSGKTFAVTLSDDAVTEKLNAIAGITIDPKTVTVTAETDGASQKIEELKRQIAELQDRNLMINAGMASLDLQNVRDLSRTGGVTGFVGIGKSMMPIEGLPSMNDVVRKRGGNLLDDKAMKAVNEDISRNLPNAKEKDSPLESGKKLLSGISQLTDGLEKIGIDIPDEIQSVIGVIQGVMQVIEAVNTIIGVTQTTALTANTVAMTSLTAALWANTASSWIPFANGGVVHAAGGIVAGNTYSGDQIPAMLNAGEVVLNRAQAGNLASQLENGASQNLKLDAVISGEQIRLVLNNNGRRTGRGEYVQSTRRR